ncbi:ABC transporter substrate-binding protein [Deferribacterales bacterium Es71-Z0220]|jgi:branched-chain amino acid transport system substrate-binding protein|uniref:ABC transporter substrate-binding protein n=1 Tax=Deferrivibrio essentukiensis TaxID=2880922 RepID=UPI001F61A127|nr:ABC transporter substrate-binding protein [Deferrivibrio essentukiensis]MCB4204066.1 ABC transporter substrate-binding protein [Deferrivibrio essentukiensis]
MIKNILITLVLLISSISYAEVKIGALFAVTGPASFLGLPEKQTLEMLVDELNANGGINGEKIELTVYDTKGSDQEARKKFLRLVKKDRVVAVIGPTRSGSTLAIKDLADNEKVPVLSCAASSRIVEPLSKYMFKVAPSDSHAVEKIFEFLLEKGKSKIAVLTAQNGFGDSGRAALEQLAPQYKIEIVANEKFRDTDKDMTSQLSKIASHNPDAVIVWGVGPAPAIVAKNFRQLNMKGYLIMSHGVASKKFIELAGDASEGVILPAGRLLVADKLPDNDRFKKLLVEYKIKYESKFNSPVSTFGGHAYDALMIFKTAYVGSKNNLIAGIEGIKGYLGTYGEFNFDSGNHDGLSKDAFVMVEIKNGDWELIK